MLWNVGMLMKADHEFVLGNLLFISVPALRGRCTKIEGVGEGESCISFTDVSLQLLLKLVPFKISWEPCKRTQNYSRKVVVNHMASQRKWIKFRTWTDRVSTGGGKMVAFLFFFKTWVCNRFYNAYSFIGNEASYVVPTAFHFLLFVWSFIQLYSL